MRNPIIVGVALREDDDAPLALAHTLAQLTGAPLALVTSYTFGMAPPHAAPEWLAAVHRQAGLALAPIAATCAEDLDVSTHVRPSTSAARALLEVAIELEASAIVVGSSHRGRVGRVLAGSVTTDLLHGAPCPVVVAPRDYIERTDGFQRIGVGFIDSPEGHAALSVACELARASDRSVAVYNVMEPIEWSPALLIDGWNVDRAINAEREEHVRSTSASARRLLPEAVLSMIEVSAGDPATILAGTSAGLDLLVCGSRRYGPSRSVILGNVSRELARSSACPLLIVPRAPAEDVPALWHDEVAMWDRATSCTSQ